MNNKNLIINIITTIIKNNPKHRYDFTTNGIKLNGYICYSVCLDNDEILFEVMGLNSSWYFNSPITDWDYDDLKKILLALIETL